MNNSRSYCNKNLADIHTPLLHNYWYVAGLSTEFTVEMRERTILEKSMVMYRKADGTPVILQNRCAHRSFPLDKSILDDEGIRCRYHGIKYNHEGEIIDVPCQTKCPKVSIKKYPAHEIGPFIWVWMGDKDKADIKDIPELPIYDMEKWTHVVSEYNHMEGNYILVHENLCDLSHLPFLHAETFKTPPAYSDTPIEMEVDGDEVKFYRSMHDWSALSAFFHPAIDFSGKEFTYISGGHYMSPATNKGYAKLTADGENKDPICHYVSHYMTPETQGSCHYYWFVARNYELDDHEYSQKFGKMVQTGFDEDRVAVKYMQDMLEQDKLDFKEMSVKADAPGLAMRKIIKRLADKEYC
ncbi:MAG: Rieske 2Fe-2S domain-containing protein [Emcibacteraceae bacterium]|nr:Rieske 2Fe-2S domain-containing protein [Emcibacteraceae bacterium]